MGVFFGGMLVDQPLLGRFTTAPNFLHFEIMALTAVHLRSGFRTASFSCCLEFLSIATVSCCKEL